MIGSCMLCGFNGEINTTVEDPNTYVCLRCYFTHYCKGVTNMGWNDVAGKGGGKKDPDVLVIAPNTTELVHVLLPDSDEPISYWTHYIPNKTQNGPKGKVIICPGMDTCPACRIGTFRTKRVHAINVWSYSAKAVKILEGGQTIFQALKQIKDQVGTLGSLDISIKKIQDPNGTSYSVIPIPMMQPFDQNQVKGLFPIDALRIHNTPEEVQQAIDQLGYGVAPVQQPTQQPTTAIPPATPHSTTGNPPPQPQPSTAQANVFPFGKYKGRTVADVYWEDPNYVKWCAENITDANIKAEAKKLISAPTTEAPKQQPSSDAAFELAQMQILIGEITYTIQNEERYKSNYGLVLEKMRSVSKSPTRPNGTTLLNEYTKQELEKLIDELKK